jgi:DNA-binding HxlR family transcriptional regulator
VKPLRAAYLGKALRLRRERDIVEAYAVWGGIPRYWELAEEFGGRLDEAVDHLVLDPLSPLHQEPDRLLSEEVPSAASLRPILDAVGLGAHRLSEIAGRIGQPATSLSRWMVRLQDLGLIRRVVELESPAHVEVKVRPATNPFLVAVSSLVGVDTYLGVKRKPRQVRVNESHLGGTDLLQGPSGFDPRRFQPPAVERPVARVRGDVTTPFGSSFRLSGTDSTAGPGQRIARFVWTRLS